MAYFFYLDKILLPVSPSKVNVKIKNNNDTITLINEGEVNILKKAGLTSIDFEFLLPNMQYPFATYTDGFKRAEFFLSQIEKLKLSEKPFTFVIQRQLPSGTAINSTNISVAIEDYTVKEDVQKFGLDFSVSIKLKQYKNYGTKVVTISNPTDEQATPAVAVAVENQRESEVSVISIGSDVIVNGVLHRDSFGNGPGQSRVNYQGKVNFIKLENPYPYHVTTPSGGWLGWVTASSVKGV